jgi:UPF0716 family protein affecting phage T7 exclusion
MSGLIIVGGVLFIAGVFIGMFIAFNIFLSFIRQGIDGKELIVDYLCEKWLESRQKKKMLGKLLVFRGDKAK